MPFGEGLLGGEALRQATAHGERTANGGVVSGGKALQQATAHGERRANGGVVSGGEALRQATAHGERTANGRVVSGGEGLQQATAHGERRANGGVVSGGEALRLTENGQPTESSKKAETSDTVAADTPKSAPDDVQEVSSRLHWLGEWEPAPMDVPMDAPMDPPMDLPMDAPMEPPMDAPMEAPMDAPMDLPMVAPMDLSDAAEAPSVPQGSDETEWAKPNFLAPSETPEEPLLEAASHNLPDTWV
ncbi:unnamed protein product, partial [Cladocopium goreaui]